MDDVKMGDHFLLESSAREIAAREKPAAAHRGYAIRPEVFQQQRKRFTPPAPGPKGPPTAQLIEDARRRRRERDREERGR